MSVIDSQSNVYVTVRIIHLKLKFITNIAIFIYPRYHRLGQSSRICVIRLFRSRWDSIAPSLREHSCITLDRLSINKYWGTGSKARNDYFLQKPEVKRSSTVKSSRRPMSISSESTHLPISGMIS